MEVGGIEGDATAGGHGPSRIPEELLPLRPPPVRAGHPGVGKALVVLAVLALCGIGAHLIRAALVTPRDAGDAKAMADARYAATTIETFALENGGSYSGASEATLAEFSTSFSESVEVTAGPTSYLITVHPGGTEREFTVWRGPDGITALGCRPAGSGACPTTGEWQ